MVRRVAAHGSRLDQRQALPAARGGLFDLAGITRRPRGRGLGAIEQAAAHAAHARSLSDVVQGMGATIDALRRELAELKARRPGADTAANDGAFNDVPRPPHRPQAPASHRPRPLANWRQLA